MFVFLHVLTLFIVWPFCLRRLSLRLRMMCDEELCSVELLSLWLQTQIRKMRVIMILKVHRFKMTLKLHRLQTWSNLDDRSRWKIIKAIKTTIVKTIPMWNLHRQKSTHFWTHHSIYLFTYIKMCVCVSVYTHTNINIYL